MQIYKHDNGLPPAGLLVAVIAAVIGGVALGALTYFVGQYIYLIVLFPILLGLATGFVVTVGIRVGKIRNVATAAVVGLLAGMVLYGTARYLEYEIQFRQDVRDELSDFGFEPSDEDVERIAALIIEEETESSGYSGFLQLQAKEGITVTRRAGTSGGLVLKDTLIWIYWLIELGVIAGIAAVMAIGQASEPFSREVNQWYGENQYLGTVSMGESTQLWELLKSGQFAAARQLMEANRETSIPRVHLNYRVTPTESSEAVLVLTTVTVNDKGAIKYSDADEFGVLPLTQVEQLRPQQAS